MAPKKQSPKAARAVPIESSTDATAVQKEDTSNAWRRVVVVWVVVVLVLLVVVEGEGAQVGGVVLAFRILGGAVFIDVLDRGSELLALHGALGGDEVLLSSGRPGKGAKKDEGREQCFHCFG